MDYIKKPVGSSGVAKAALALGITGTGLSVLSNAGGGGGVLTNLFGNRPATVVAPGTTVVSEGYVTDREMRLIRESNEKDALIAKYQANEYTNIAVKTETEPLKTRVCELEKYVAVNQARDMDFRHYVNREFVHQPKAKIRESIVTCKQCGCECECC